MRLELAMAETKAQQALREAREQAARDVPGNPPTFPGDTPNEETPEEDDD